MRRHDPSASAIALLMAQPEIPFEDWAVWLAHLGRLGVNATEIDNTLYDAFGQRQVSTIYSAQNQYHVIMEVEPHKPPKPGRWPATTRAIDTAWPFTRSATPTGLDRS